MDTSRKAIAVAVVVALSGCSMAISGPAKDRRRGQMPRCDTGKGAVALDGVGATAFGLAGLGTLAADEKEAGLILLGLSTALVVAAMTGDRNATNCRLAFDQYAQETRIPELETDTLRASTPSMVAPTATARRVEAPLANEPVDVAEPPHAEAVAPVPTPTPAPAPAPAPSPKPAATPPKPAAPAPVDDTPSWDQFWREVP